MAIGQAGQAGETYTAIDYLLPLLYVIAITWYCAFWGISLVGWSTARKVYSRRSRSPLSSLHPEAIPGVSIIRPLKGLDPNLYENLESSFLQEYSNFEVIFSVHNKDDQALTVVDELVRKYPAVPVQVITSEQIVGVNPKINNLVTPFQRANHDIVWVLDSNVCVQPGTLARSVDVLTRVYPDPSTRPSMMRSQFRPRVGVVHHVPFAVLHGAMNSLGSRVEAAFLNTNHARMYIAINRLVLDSCVLGKSNMYRRSDIAHLTGLPSSRNQYKSRKAVPNGEAELPCYPSDVVTGLPAFADYLAEDNMIASSMMHELGLLHDVSCDVAINAIGEMSFSDYVERRVRWIRVRRHMVLSATIIEPFTECLALCLIGMFSVGSILGIPPLLFAATHCAAWLSVDLGVYAALAGHPLPTSEWWSFIGAWAIREITAFPIWVIGVVGNEVTWRGEPYTMLRNGRVRRREKNQPRCGDYEVLPSDV